MSEVKFFELRDAATFMPVMAVRPESAFDEDVYLMRRAGFGPEGVAERYVFLLPLEKENWTWDPNKWSSRTLLVAHAYILEHWDELPTGCVVDVEFILGVRTVPKESERVKFPIA